MARGFFDPNAVPKAWADTAAVPRGWVADDLVNVAAPAPSGGIVGDDTAGTGTSPASGDRAWLSQFAMPGAGDGVTGYLRFDATSGAGTNAKFLVYADNGSGQPGALLYASTGQAVPGGGGVLTYSVSVPGLTAAQLIWLGGVTDSFQAEFQVDTSGGQSRMEGTTYATPAGTWTESGTGAGRMNAWMDYTSSGGGGPTYTLGADGGTFALTGAAAGLIYGRRLQADAGSFALTGAAANLVRGRRLVADSGAFTFTGADATLTYTPVGGYTLVAESGSYTFTGQPANLIYNRVLVAQAGAYALTGSDATLTYTGTPGSYTLTAESDSYTLSGPDATLMYSGAQSQAAGGGSFHDAAAQWESRSKWAKEARKLLDELLDSDDAEPVAATPMQAAQDAPQQPRTAEPAPYAPVSTAAMDALLQRSYAADATALLQAIQQREFERIVLMAMQAEQRIREDEEAVAMLLLLSEAE